MGSGGGAGGRHDGYAPGLGGNGGGIILITAKNISNSGNIQSRGNNGGNFGYASGGGGGGAGGSVYLSAHDFVNSGTVSLTGGIGGNGQYNGSKGGNGGKGRTRIDYLVLNNTGTIDPAAYEGTFKNISTVQLLNTPKTTGSYQVKAYIYDTDSDPITQARVFYRVDGGSYNQLVMSTGDGELFTANIPAQSANKVIDYYITATDGSDNYADPADAPSGYYSFKVTALAPYSVVLTNNSNLNVSVKWNRPRDLTNFVSYSVYRSENPDFVPGVANRIAQGLSDSTYLNTGLLDRHTYYYSIGAYYNLGGTGVTEYSSKQSIVVNDTSTTSVLGYVYLEGQSNHSNIKIKFNPISPSAELDSTYTNALGFYEKQINPGVYTITYEKAGYQTYPRVSDLSIINDLDLGQSTIYFLGTQVSGNVEGVWNGIYSVTGDITVPNGDTLIIQPGSEIRFTGYYGIYVYGYLRANGISGDSILFTSRPANQIYSRGQWRGIDFYDASNDNSSLKYIVLQYADEGITWDNARANLSNSRIHNSSVYGLRIYNEESDLTITDVDISYCSSHGIYVYIADPILRRISSHHNSGYGIYLENTSYATVKSSKFSNNSSHGVRCINWSGTVFDSCEIKNNTSWGVRVDYSNPNFLNTTISGNYGYGMRFNNDNANWIVYTIDKCIIENNTSHGISQNYYSRKDAYITNNIIRYNGSSGIFLNHNHYTNIFNNTIYSNNGHGIQLESSENYPEIHHNIICYNNGDGIYKTNNGAPTIEYNTIYGNVGDGIEINTGGYTDIIKNNIVVNNSGYGIRANTAIEVFQYNDVYGNTTGQLLNLGNFPVDTWTFLSFNVNGAPADNYLNISSEPGLSMTNSLDFLLRLNSLCLNAGNPAKTDPDGTASDVGAVYRHLGNPISLSVTGTGNQSVSLKWNRSALDTIQYYKVFYKLNANSTYTYFTNTTDTFATVTGLTNNSLYDFVITGKYPNYESGYSAKVSEKPGTPAISLNPSAFNVTVNQDTVARALKITNTGSKELSLDFALGAENGFVHFDGTDDYLQIGDHSNLEGMSALTIEFWIRNNNTGWTEPVGKRYMNYQMTMEIANDRFGMYKGWNGSDYQHWYGYYDFNVSQWYHLAVTWTGNTIKFYVNGNLVNEYNNAVSNPIPNHGANFQLGKRSDEWTYILNGDLAEVRVWNIVRTADQIKRYKDQTLPAPQAGLVGYWPLHKDYTDKSGNGRTGTPNYNTYISSSATPTFPALPFVLSQKQITVAPGTTDSVIFKFYNTGQTGTFTYTTPVYTNISTTPQIDYALSLTYGTEVPSTPVYFTPVASTGKPYQVVITDAEIDGTDIGVGDEIGLFDDTLCVGAGLFDGSFNLVITAWEQGGTAGFIPGHPITFRIYDNSADLEAIVENVVYLVGDGTFKFNQFTSVKLYSTIYRIQNIPVPQNQFALVSFNRLPRFAQATSVFDDIDSLKIAYNDDGKALIPKYNINTIGTIDFRDAYYIYTTKADTFRYQGTSINPTLWNIGVKPKRWNYISFLGESPAAITTVFPSAFHDSIDIVQTSDGKMYIPSLAVNTIGNMLPGTGYMIALIANTEKAFAYQITNGLKNMSVLKSEPVPSHFTFDKTGLPYNIIISAPEGLEIGDEIGIVDQGLCVGAAVYTGQPLTTVTAWQKDNTYGLKGYTPSDSIGAKIYSVSRTIELPAALTSLNSNPGNLLFNGGTYSYITLKALDGTTTVAGITDHAVFTCYPNPFSEEVQFTYELPFAAHVSLTISNITGQPVATLVNEVQLAGKHIIQWQEDQLQSGVYQYTFIYGDNKLSGKIILIK